MKRIQWAGFVAIFILSACAQLVGIEEPIDPPPEGTGGTGNGGSGTGAGQANGVACTADAQCDSMHCTDGVCCDTGCTETCKTCKLTGKVGTCVDVPAYEDDANGATMCVGTIQSCDGHGVCKLEIGQACSTKNDCLQSECLTGVCTPPSCDGLAATCGPLVNETEHCCLSNVVTGGTFNRSNDPTAPATITSFRLDRFEVTVGRFRKFVEAYQGNGSMVADAGKHPLIPGSGWDPAWITSLPADQDFLKTSLKCDPMYQTWTDAVGGNERLPISCVSWYLAFAFCAWDGGRLPTESEWNYAAAGGDDQRQYPWSNPPNSTTITSDYAVYDCAASTGGCAFADILKVGSKSPLGDGKWQQADLAGSIWEWALDVDQAYASPCVDCANLGTGSNRIIRGGGWFPVAAQQLTSFRNSKSPDLRDPGIGIRCARDL